MTRDGNNFNDFPDTQLTKFRVFIGSSRIFTLSPTLKFYEASRLVPHRMDAPDRHSGQTDVSLCQGRTVNYGGDGGDVSPQNL